MAQVDISINAKAYRISCEDGQENRIRDLARMVDAHVGDLVEQVGQIGDARLLVMASLLVADELADLRDVAVDEVVEGESDFSPEDEERIAAAIESLADRVERIAVLLAGA
ncbi:MAG: cell division protein ZapA [Rhodospirillaceae bacterium]|nr:cell division protein ZapA [Rhodospirillaceae bacterium]MBT6140232.1 cell division protein ZapA [Rhodospirillaceae bacterium]